MLPYMKNYVHFAIASPILMILEVLADIIIPYLMSLIVDVGIANQDINYIVRLGIIMIVSALLAMLFGILSAHAGARAGFGFAAEIRKEAFRRVQGFSFANLDKFAVSSLITRLTNDCNTIGQVTMMSLRMAVRAPFLALFALIMALRINASLARVFMFVIPVTALIITVVLSKALPLFKLLQHRVDRVNAIIQENLIGIRVVKSFNRQDYEEKRFQDRNDALRDTALKAISLVVFLMPVINLIIYGTIMAVLWFGGRQIVAGTMGGGELISFITYITQVLMALILISFFFMQLLRGAASVSRILEIFNTESEIKQIDKPVNQVKDGSLSFRNVSFIYPGSSEKTLKILILNWKQEKS